MSAQSHGRSEEHANNGPYGILHRTALPPAPSAVSANEDSTTSEYVVQGEQDRNGRPKRKRISPQQLEALLELFQQTDTPSYEQRERVAARLGMSNREVQVWFQNRRAKERNAKQKQQLLEHRERLERVERSGQDQDATPTQPTESTFSTPHTYSSPLHIPVDALPSGFDGSRRRSLSTSALEHTHATPSDVAYRHSHNLPNAEACHTQPFGPMRPRFNRYHTMLPQYSFGRPSSARSDIQPHSRSPPARLGQLEQDTARRSPRQGEMVLPLPTPRYRYGHSPTSSFNARPSSSSASVTIADRRENRLPPIRMLLDMADSAAAEFSPSLSGVPSSSHSCGLYSPFSDLHLNTPGSEDGRQTEYFSSRDTHVSRDERATPSTEYTFGRTFR
ncbi:homeobox-domain-containing protein [Cystobasidium minutum MCA 4210]|uniref:homeobox-domain-containing protein n=1 Tax=Cystobasidium minutum MCA 4210 TaxID=1397322 RepID=UPI0034CFA011|eukprot:jgi/Rhomi1/194168/gm1.2382_g